MEGIDFELEVAEIPISISSTFDHFDPVVDALHFGR